MLNIPHCVSGVGPPYFILFDGINLEHSFFFFYEHSQKGDKYLNTSTLYKNGQLGPHIEKVFSIGSQILQ